MDRCHRDSGLTIFQQLPIGRQTLSSHPFFNPKPSHCNLLNSRTLPKVHVVWHSACRAYLQKELKLASFYVYKCGKPGSTWKRISLGGSSSRSDAVLPSRVCHAVWR